MSLSEFVKIDAQLIGSLLFIGLVWSTSRFVKKEKWNHAVIAGFNALWVLLSITR